MKARKTYTSLVRAQLAVDASRLPRFLKMIATYPKIEMKLKGKDVERFRPSFEPKCAADVICIYDAGFFAEDLVINEKLEDPYSEEQAFTEHGKPTDGIPPFRPNMTAKQIDRTNKKVDAQLRQSQIRQDERERKERRTNNLLMLGGAILFLVAIAIATS